MIDEATAIEVAERYRQANGFRPFLLGLLALAYGDGASWEPASKAAVRRALTRPRDEELCSEADAQAALEHAVAMGIIGEGSHLRHIILLTAEVAA